MRIGILTYHRAENYGALLQAYAMMSFLRDNGHDVSFVDYWPKYHSDYFAIFSLKDFLHSSIKSKLIKLCKILIMGRVLFYRRRVMKDFMYEQLGLPISPKYEDRFSVTEEVYDAVIYGSDQIWRKQNLGGVEFDDWYFGSKNVRARKKIVYAGSMGKIEESPNDNEFFRKHLCNFNSIAVREADLLNYLKKLGVNSIQVIDPVFLISKEKWERLVISQRIKKRYILFYNLLNTKESYTYARRLSRQLRLPVYEVTRKMSVFSSQSHLINKASVGEFLGLIKDAEYVISNSFHGVAFSIIFEKQFYAVGMGEKANRVISLLESIGMADHYLTSSPNENILKLSKIDYKDENIQQCLKVLINKSSSYLFNVLK